MRTGRLQRPPLDGDAQRRRMGTLKLNCALVDKVEHGVCTTVPPQTIETGVFWKNEGTNTLGVMLSRARSKSLTHTGTCPGGGTPTTEELSAEFLITGIHAS
jgi:hypothetical protein